MFFSVQNFSFGQSVIRFYPKILQSSSDTFTVKFSDLSYLFRLPIGKQDTVDVGTDGTPGLSATIHFGKDSLNIIYNNLPYEQVHYIPIQFQQRKIVYRLHFNAITSLFPVSYMDKNKGNVQIDIPEVYELANIIWSLSPSGQRATNLNKEGVYYQKVLSYFKPYLNHPVFKKLDFTDSFYIKNYYDFRENSFAFNFRENKIVCDGPYYYVMGNDSKDFNSLFRQMLPLIEDFARKSKYRFFYKSNKHLYFQQIKRLKELLPVKDMWSWLEQQFPPTQYHSYKVIFSPLIGGSHSTQNFSTKNKNERFGETVMFISNTDRYDKKSELTEKQKEGLMSGIVFTEIDHNYVNPASSKYVKLIDSIFSARALWAGSEASWYDDPVSVFNEYMTHAVFCLWVLENYDKTTADFVIADRESLMVDRRQFIRFKEFNRALIAISERNKDRKIIDFYTNILDWCKTQN